MFFGRNGENVATVDVPGAFQASIPTTVTRMNEIDRGTLADLVLERLEKMLTRNYMLAGPLESCACCTDDRISLAGRTDCSEAET